MSRFLPWAAVCAIAAGSLSPAGAADYEHPLVNAKVGDWMLFKITNDNAGEEKLERKFTVTDKAGNFISIRMDVIVDGRTINSSDQKIDVQEKFNPNVFKGGGSAILTEEGKDTLSIKGKKVETKTLKYKVALDNGITGTTKVWLDPDMPLGVVQSEEVQGKSTLRAILEDFGRK